MLTLMHNFYTLAQAEGATVAGWVLGRPGSGETVLKACCTDRLN